MDIMNAIQHRKRMTTSVRKMRRIIDNDRLRKLGTGTVGHTSCVDCDAKHFLYVQGRNMLERDLTIYCDNGKLIGVENDVVSRRFIPTWCPKGRDKMIGKSVTRKEALRISKLTLEEAEKERIKAVEEEAKNTETEE